MSISIDQAFIKQYEAEVHEAYQQRGSKLRHTVRLKTGVEGKSTTFQKVGKGTAGQKTRHGNVPVMNIDHTPVECTLEDWYAGDWVDKLDELKTNIDERQVQVNAGAFALGRKIDSLIITAARSGLSSDQKVAEGSAGLTKSKILQAFELLNDADVPDDGQRYAIVGAHQWNELLNITEFKSADYVGASELPWLAGTQAKRWLNMIWIMHTGLPVSSGTRYCLMYHRTALGLAEGITGVWTDITWHGDKAAHFVDNAISAGAVRIDSTGIVEIACDDDAAIS